MTQRGYANGSSSTSNTASRDALVRIAFVDISGSYPSEGPVDWTARPLEPPTRTRSGDRLTRGCVASISGIEVGEASRRRRIVAKEPAHLYTPMTTTWRWLPKTLRLPVRSGFVIRPDVTSFRMAHRSARPRGRAGN